jgi:hypothetical protein
MAPPAPHKGGDAENRQNPFSIISSLSIRGFLLTDVVNHIGQHGPDMFIAHHIKHLPPAPIRL